MLVDGLEDDYSIEGKEISILLKQKLVCTGKFGGAYREESSVIIYTKEQRSRDIARQGHAAKRICLKRFNRVFLERRGCPDSAP